MCVYVDKNDTEMAGGKQTSSLVSKTFDINDIKNSHGRTHSTGLGWSHTWL